MSCRRSRREADVAAAAVGRTDKERENARLAAMRAMHQAVRQQQQVLLRIISFLEPMEPMTPRAYNTFMRVKSTIYMSRAHKYFGMFDCLVGFARCGRASGRVLMLVWWVSAALLRPRQ
jgi:hypothetical protein